MSALFERLFVEHFNGFVVLFLPGCTALANPTGQLFSGFLEPGTHLGTADADGGILMQRTKHNMVYRNGNSLRNTCE